MRALLAASLLVLPLALRAQGLAIPCNPEGSQAELNACAVDAFHRAEREMNETYEAVMAALAPDRRKALRAEQDAWLNDRGRKCTDEVRQFEGGSIWRQMYLGCRQVETQARASEIARWAARK